ncbi:MAG TPA: PhnD/SsuA/transferrin family substrate-binding protein [Symbiobacteriaceae bacterium]
MAEVPPPPQPRETLRIGVVTVLSPKESFAAYRDFADYLAGATKLPASLVLRKTYSEVNDLVRTGAVDLALVGYGGFLAGQKQFGMQLLAAGQVEGTTQSTALVLVRAEGAIGSYQDLKDHAFAFTDPLSYAGHLALREWLGRQGLSPEAFHSRIVYTFSHDGSVDAVLGRVVDGALVDAYWYRAYLSHHPELDGKLRVIARFETPGFMVSVTRPDLPAARKRFLQAILLNMADTAEGRRVLAGLMMERFVMPAGEGERHDR